MSYWVGIRGVAHCHCGFESEHPNLATAREALKAHAEYCDRAKELL